MDFSSYFQVGSKSRPVGLGLSRRPPSAGQAPLAALRGSLGLDVYLSCETDVYIYHALWSSGLSWLIKTNIIIIKLRTESAAKINSAIKCFWGSSSHGDLDRIGLRDVITPCMCVCVYLSCASDFLRINSPNLGMTGLPDDGMFFFILTIHSQSDRI